MPWQGSIQIYHKREQMIIKSLLSLSIARSTSILWYLFTDLQIAEAQAAEEDDEDDDGLPKKSPDAATQLLIVKPDDSGNLPAGSIANVLVGFKNTGKSNFIVNAMEASFRYPQDFNYFIQNVSLSNNGSTVRKWIIYFLIAIL